MDASKINKEFLERAGDRDSGRPLMIITGGSRGLGRELVRHFSGSHDISFGWHQSRDAAEALFKELKDQGCWTLPRQLDVTDAAQVRSWADHIEGKLGGAQVLIHTTGTFGMTALAGTSPETWRRELDSTVTAGFLAWWAFGAQLQGRKRSRVIFIGDSAAEQMRARKQSTAYYVGKHGLVLLARSIASECQGVGLTCNVVSPGVLPNSVDIDQPGMSVNVGFNEIASVIGFLLKPEADAVSGSNLIASRGWNV